MKRTIISLTFTLLLGLCLFSCVKDNNGEKNEDLPKEEKNECTVIFDTNGGTEIPMLTLKKGELIPEPLSPKKEGYFFLGWYSDGKKWTFTKKAVTEDTTLSASYALLDYTITYELSGGEFSDTPKSTYTVEDEEYLLPIPTNGSKKFDGWLSEGKIVDRIPAASTGELTFTALFYDTKPEVLSRENQSMPDPPVYAYNNSESVYVRSIGEDGEKLTLRVEIPDDWNYVKVEYPDVSLYTQAQKTGEKTTVNITIKSNRETAKLSPITKTNEDKTESGFGIILSDGTVVDKNYFPGFVRKTVTFPLDDGIYAHDKKVIDILSPYGFKGTFNINNPSGVIDPDIYKGFEIANHHLLHTTAMRTGFDYSQFTFSDQPLPEASEQDKNVIYRNYGRRNENGEWIEGFYYVHYSIYGSTAGWHPLATDETYIEYLAKTTEQLEAIFGEGSIVGFAYPHGGSANETIRENIKNSGYLYARSTGNLKSTTGFALPTNRFAWTYNADHNCLLSVMAEFDVYEDDGNLKMFAFGVHAKDFETYEKWGDLETFAELYGNREKDFWYATNRQIFEYEDALNAMIITDEAITNNSKIDLFVTVNGEKIIIFANSTYNLK